MKIDLTPRQLIRLITLVEMHVRNLEYEVKKAELTGNILTANEIVTMELEGDREILEILADLKQNPRQEPPIDIPF